jgi:ketosteroid isomerase-like protein
MRPYIAALLVCLSFPSSSALGQSVPAPAAACTTDVAADSANPVLHELDAQYARLAAAMRARDVDALFALYTPDYHVVMPGGEVWSRERSLAYQRNGLARVGETHHISNTILHLVVCGDRATATVLQQWYRTQMMDGVPRRVETNAVQDEVWVRGANGWKRGDIREVRNGASFVDGKRVDIRRPYKPDAPPYDPYAALPR